MSIKIKWFFKNKLHPSNQLQGDGIAPTDICIINLEYMESSNSLDGGGEGGERSKPGKKKRRKVGQIIFF